VNLGVDEPDTALGTFEVPNSRRGSLAPLAEDRIHLNALLMGVPIAGWPQPSQAVANAGGDTSDFTPLGTDGKF
jgi:hypothetical protein